MLLRYGDDLVFDFVFVDTSGGTITGHASNILCYLYAPDGTLIDLGTAPAEIGLGLYTISYSFETHVAPYGAGAYRAVAYYAAGGGDPVAERTHQYAKWQVSHAVFTVADLLITAICPRADHLFGDDSVGAALQMILCGGFVAGNPFNPDDSTIRIYRSASYGITTGTILFAPNTVDWPDLTGATCTLFIGPLFTAPGVVTAVGPGFAGRVQTDLSIADTSQLAAGVHRFTLRATWGDPETAATILVQGQCAVYPVP